ncbi:MAG TPA: SET domain-containing protein [Nevskiaceae bacterium]
MILPSYRLAPSAIPGAGKGLFVAEPVAPGRVVIAPDNVHTVWDEARLRRFDPESLEVRSSVRWFERQFSLTPEWTDECYVNHSFSPTALWHLGFLFALRELPSGTEVTMDYRLAIGDGERMPFRDAASGAEIVGWPWHAALARSTSLLAQLFPAVAGYAAPT